MDHGNCGKMHIYADRTILSFFLQSVNYPISQISSELDIWEHLLTHQLVLFYMHRPSEGLQSAQGSKVMNNRQDSILNRPRIMALRADH